MQYKRELSSITGCFMFLFAKSDSFYIYKYNQSMQCQFEISFQKKLWLEKALREHKPPQDSYYFKSAPYVCKITCSNFKTKFIRKEISFQHTCFRLIIVAFEVILQFCNWCHVFEALCILCTLGTNKNSQCSAKDCLGL